MENSLKVILQSTLMSRAHQTKNFENTIYQQCLMYMFEFFPILLKKLTFQMASWLHTVLIRRLICEFCPVVKL